ncbi:hypothetical protein RAS12_29565 [Achromobacter seleniivolatilans]|uniref:Lipoprotein SmpA/OmlA domain-containing protein n=1 Tax=Achromobacter seleniivolatilans TaxID=3047478 RepID=A0ABY9M139_9BURK|nr:hypothetical protein [Achromobacter sp. R39]WMD20690.1 hypothetical protein RAS12_29565 [Achromobacter sp. R39]
MSLLFVAAIVTGCAATSSGDLISEAKIAAIKIHVTTFDEMARDFGPPRTQHVNPQGIRTATWFYFNNSEYGAVQDQRTLTVIYNQDGTVKDYMNASSGQTEKKPGR